MKINPTKVEFEKEDYIKLTEDIDKLEKELQTNILIKNKVLVFMDLLNTQVKLIDRSNGYKLTPRDLITKTIKNIQIGNVMSSATLGEVTIYIDFE